jgi:hypothetical protein
LMYPVNFFSMRAMIASVILFTLSIGPWLNGNRFSIKATVRKPVSFRGCRQGACASTGRGEILRTNNVTE